MQAFRDNPPKEIAGIPVARVRDYLHASTTNSDGTTESAVDYAFAVDIAAVNDAPVANADTLSVVENTAMAFDVSSLLANDIDVDGDELLVSVQGPIHGVLTDLGDGRLVYEPPADFIGEDQLIYQIDDGD